MKVSVAMCTFNGAKYIDEQLSSILNQNYVIDEIIIVDDCSTDNTVSMIKKYIYKNKNIKLFNNLNNLGYKKNFKKALSLCTGDLIFFSDQDDVWKYNKVSKLVNFIKKYNYDVVFTNAKLIDEFNSELNYTLWESINYDNKVCLFSELLKRNCCTGATMVLQKSFYERYKDIPDCWVHDGWFAFCGCINNSLGCLDENLTLYRQHSGNQIGAKKKTFSDFFSKFDMSYYYSNYEERIQRYNSILKLTKDKDIINKLHEGINFYNHRKIALKQKTLKSLIKLISLYFNGYYNNYSNGISGLFTDYLLIIRSFLL